MPLPDSEAVWVVEESNSELWMYTKYFYPDENRDTIINGEVYHKIFSKGVHITHPWPNPDDPTFGGLKYYGACRSDDSGRSWLNLAEGSFVNQDILFMDMTVEKGDTLWQLPTYSPYGSEYVFSDLVVDSTDAVESGAVSHKRIFLRNLDPPYGMECPFIWVEGIGNVASGLLNAVGCGFENVYLSCMSIGDTILAAFCEVYQNPSVGVCDLPFTDNIDFPFLSDKIVVYPNPASEYVVFELTDATINAYPNRQTIFITDIYGRPVAEVAVTGKETLWPVGDLAPGVYFYKFSNGKYTNSGKFLIFN
ncbi:hypothetical protein MASR1M74_07970 [Lentimicrobium sp.]